MATTTTTRNCKVDLINPIGSSYARIQTQEANKLTLRIPGNPNFGSGVFTNLIHFTITLQMKER